MLLAQNFCKQRRSIVTVAFPVQPDDPLAKRCRLASIRCSPSAAMNQPGFATLPISRLDPIQLPAAYPEHCRCLFIAQVTRL
jgi:hypothetical protein